VLVAEDEPDIQLFSRLYLEMAGFRVLQAMTAEEALTLLASDAPDVVLLDLRMPGIGGWGFLDRMAAEGGRVPVVAMSAHGDPSTIAQALARGCAGYVTKPFLPSDLVQALDAALLAGDAR
jgi:two-component system, OmpR family, alkaline phosphatase synthesis response regulator PhoP